MEQNLYIRMFLFFFFLISFSFWERSFPKRKRRQEIYKRWTSNILMMASAQVLIKILFPITAFLWAISVNKNGWGLFNSLSLNSSILTVILSIVMLDFFVYWQHVFYHRIPFFWHFHKVHHIDLDLDVTSGIRFHPIEMAFSQLFKFVIIAIFGMPALSIVLFEVLINSTSLFNHANINLSERWDKVLRRFIVTPDMHRVHHSILKKETNSNFGFNLPVWDWIFRTYKSTPQNGHEKMTLGLEQYQQDQKVTSLPWLLYLPISTFFTNKKK